MRLQTELACTRTALAEMEKELAQEKDARVRAEVGMQRAKSASRSLARRNVEQRRRTDGYLPALSASTRDLDAAGTTSLFSQPQATEILALYKQQLSLVQEMLQDYLTQNKELRAQLKHYQDIESAEGEALARQLELEEGQYEEYADSPTQSLGTMAPGGRRDSAIASTARRRSERAADRPLASHRSGQGQGQESVGSGTEAVDVIL